MVESSRENSLGETLFLGHDNAGNPFRHAERSGERLNNAAYTIGPIDAWRKPRNGLCTGLHPGNDTRTY